LLGFLLVSPFFFVGAVAAVAGRRTVPSADPIPVDDTDATNSAVLGLGDVLHTEDGAAKHGPADNGEFIRYIFIGKQKQTLKLKLGVPSTF
jgi:hypothetical protein